MNTGGTFLALIPPLVAIVISLVTKEVNLSLFIGLFTGTLIFCSGSPFQSVATMFDIMADKVKGNMGVLIFIVLLGMVVYLMNLSGATHRYAAWASKKLKTKRSTLFATMALGIVIFVDDYFNCLTVGTVMRPITDRNHISREKLAYIIDSTAAPVCIVAPISSWAAAVTSSLPDGSSIDGFGLFLSTILPNYYTWFSLALIVLTTILAVDFGKMRKYEQSFDPASYAAVETKEEEEPKGRVVDLLLPIIALILFSIIAMLYTGGLFSGEASGIGDAFANCDAITALAMGAFYTVIFVAILYLPRKVVSPKQFLDGLVEGFKNMVPATLILILAWSLSGICGGEYLNAGGFVAGVVDTYRISLTFMPAVFFVVSLLLAFSTGTSWGTFAIMIPIVVSVFGDRASEVMSMTVAAILGGSVCGDHLSPISDTTILSSAGAECNHINHVDSQLQYGAVVAVCTLICYIIGSATKNAWIPLIAGIAMLLVFTLVMKKYYSGQDNKK